MIPRTEAQRVTQRTRAGRPAPSFQGGGDAETEVPRGQGEGQLGNDEGGPQGEGGPTREGRQGAPTGRD
jgi:hypothetical protein